MSVHQQTAFRFHVAESENGITVGFPADTALTEANAEALQRELLTLSTSRTHPHLIVDLAGITILTSVVLSKFLAINKQVQAIGGRFSLHNPTPTVQMVFKVTRLDTILDVQTDSTVLPA